MSERYRSNYSRESEEPAGDYSFHQAKEKIENELEKYRAGADGQVLPPVNYKPGQSKYGSDIVSFNIPKTSDRFSLVLSINHHSGELNFSNSIAPSFKAKNGLEVVFYHGSVSFHKYRGFDYSDLDSIISTYRNANSISEQSPRIALESLGARIYDSKNAPSWDYIAGYEGVKQQVKDSIILPYKHPEIYEQIARKTRKIHEPNSPKATLFKGPPGTGKTTMARIIAGEIDAPLVYMPIESIMSKWYSESPSKLAAVFDACNMLDKSLLFLDEIDSLATTRAGYIHEETRRVLSVLLRKIDGFVANKNVGLIGATNRDLDLDPALLSRFDASIEFPLPNMKERQAIFENYAMHLNPSELEELAQESDGFSGRDIRNFCGRGERRWASHLIDKGASNVEKGPPLEVYKSG